MKKSSKCRKRHVPPGPCGVWFRAQQHSNKQAVGAQHHAQGLGGSGVYGAAGAGMSQPPPAAVCDKHGQVVVNADMGSYSPAWSSMQQDLDILTPYLPAWVDSSSPKKCYEFYRRHYPPKYVLLWEILDGAHDFTIQDPSRLLVLVTEVESHIHHNIWTVKLQDETGARVRAWMEPRYVQQQMQQQHPEHSSSTIRPGMVWMLRKVTMIVVSNPNDDDEKIERMLLISGKQIEKFWSPDNNGNGNGNGNNTNSSSNNADSPESQRRYLRWMEKRKALTAGFSGNRDEANTHEPVHGHQQHESDSGGYESDGYQHLNDARDSANDRAGVVADERQQKNTDIQDVTEPGPHNVSSSSQRSMETNTDASSLLITQRSVQIPSQRGASGHHKSESSQNDTDTFCDASNPHPPAARPPRHVGQMTQQRKRRRADPRVPGVASRPHSSELSQATTTKSSQVVSNGKGTHGGRKHNEDEISTTGEGATPGWKQPKQQISATDRPPRRGEGGDGAKPRTDPQQMARDESRQSSSNQIRKSPTRRQQEEPRYAIWDLYDTALLETLQEDDASGNGNAGRKVDTPNVAGTNDAAGDRLPEKQHDCDQPENTTSVFNVTNFLCVDVAIFNDEEGPDNTR